MNKKSKIILLLVLCAAAVVAWSFTGKAAPKLDEKVISGNLSPEEKKQAEADAAAAAAAASSSSEAGSRRVTGNK
jgi:hypothetical protein